MKITTEEVTVTPAMAAEWLEDHYTRLDKKKFVQRNISPTTVNRYAADMLNGDWQLSPEPISFDEEGNLINGQHRLSAVVKSGKRIPFFISRGWPKSGDNGKSTMDTIDRGRGRSVGQQLALHGYMHANAYAGCVTKVARLCWARTCSVSVPGAMFILDQLDLRRHIDRLLTKASAPRDFQGRFVGPLAFYHTVFPDKAEAFADAVFNFSAAKGSPSQTFLQWLKQCNRAPEIYMRGLCACLRAHHEGNEISMVRLNLEAVRFVGSLNPKLRDNIKAHTSSH